MNKKRIISILIMVSMVITCLSIRRGSADSVFTNAQQKRADTIARVCMENWDTYGCLPSVAIAQAFVESTLGEHCSGYNLWGIKSGAVSYSSLEDGVYGYMKVINNGYYKNAPFCKDYHNQIRQILNGGYCVPVGDYYENVIWTINQYGLDKYDKKMFKQIRNQREKEKREKKQSKIFTVIYDNTVPDNAAVVDERIIKKGTVNIWKDKRLQGIYDVTGGEKGYTIRVNNPYLNNMKVKLDVHEEAKG